MSFLKELKSWLGMDTNSATSPDGVNQDNPLFVYIKIPGDLDPIDRGKRFADPLEELLERENLGAVTGGGSQLSEPDEEGECSVEFCGIDVDLYDAAKGLALIRNELVRLEAPPGTLLLYELEGREWQDPIYPVGRVN